MQNYVTSPEQNAPQHGSSNQASISNLLQQPSRSNTTRTMPSEFSMEQGGAPPATKRRKSGTATTFVGSHQSDQSYGQYHFVQQLPPVYFTQQAAAMPMMAVTSRNNNTNTRSQRPMGFVDALSQRSQSNANNNIFNNNSDKNHQQVVIPTSQVISNPNNQQHVSIPIGYSNQIQINNSQQQQQQISQQMLHQTNQQFPLTLYPLQQMQQVQQQIQPIHTSPIMDQLYVNDNMPSSNISSTQEPLQQLQQRLEVLRSEIENKEYYQSHCDELNNLLQHNDNVYSPLCQESLFLCLKNIRIKAPYSLETALKVFHSAFKNSGRFSNQTHQRDIRKWHSDLKALSGVNDRGSRSNTLNSGHSLNRLRQQQQQQQQLAQLIHNQQLNVPVNPPRIEQRPITEIEKANANWISRIVDRAWGHVMLPFESHIIGQHRGEQEFVNSFYIPHEKFERIWKPETPFPPVHIHPNKLPVTYRLISRKPGNLDDDNKCDWPPEEATFKIHINDLEVKLNRKQRIPIKSNQYSFVGVDKPVDVVQYLVAGVNKIKFTQCMCEPCRQQLYDHILSIEILVKETEEIVLRNARSQTLTTEHGTEIVKRLISGPSSSKQSPKSPTSSIGTPCHNVAMIIDDDCDITVNKMKVSLRCPISLLRISEPAKGQNCRHIGCFDLQTYVNVNKKNCKWRCPECNDRVTSETLRIDEFFNKLLRDIPDKVNTVELDSSGKWTVVGQDDGDGGETTDDDDVMQIDPVSKKSSLTSTTSKSDKAPAAIIISDDDDEPETPSSNNQQQSQNNNNTFVQPQRPIAIRQSSTPGVPYMQPIRPSNIQTNDQPQSILLQSPPPSASISLPTLMQSPPEMNTIYIEPLRPNNTPSNTTPSNIPSNTNGNKKKRKRSKSRRKEVEVTQEKGNSSTMDNNNDISSSRSWSHTMGITPSQPNYNNALSPQDITQTATQVASPISPVSVTNPNLSHTIQDEEEEGEWLTEDEQEEVVLESSTAVTVKKPYIENRIWSV